MPTCRVPIVRRLALLLLVVIGISFITSGCATVRYPHAFKVEGKEFAEFKELDDDRALKVIARIYNVPHDVWEDTIARSLALDEYIGLVKKRRSPQIASSGVFDLQYEKIKLSTWKERDLLKLYHALLPKAENYYMDVAPALNEIENASRIVYLTGIAVVVKELKKRDENRNLAQVATQVLAAALTIAVSII